MLVDILLVGIGVIWVLAAALFDIKTTEVPDWLSFSFVSLALGVRLLYSLVYSDWWFTLYGLAGVGAALVIGVVFYYGRIWGGGDSKLLLGVGAAFATAPGFLSPSLPFFVVVLVNILIFGAVYGLVWAAVLLAKNFRKVLSEVLKVFSSTVYLRYAMVAFAIVAFAISPLMEDVFMKALVIVVGLSFVAYYLLFIFIRAVENAVLIRKVPVSKLRVGDWIAEPVNCDKKLICSPKDYGLTQSQLTRLKSMNVRFVTVREGMVFIPAFVFGLAFSLVFGEIVFMLF